MDVLPCLLRTIHTRASLAHPSVTSQNSDQCRGTFSVACGVSLVVAFSLLQKSFLQRLVMSLTILPQRECMRRLPWPLGVLMLLHDTMLTGSNAHRVDIVFSAADRYWVTAANGPMLVVGLSSIVRFLETCRKGV